MSGTVDRRVDSLADRFEQQWRAGPPPQLGDYLSGVPEADRPEAVRELIRLDLEYRLRAGADARVESYLAHHPELEADRGALLDLIVQEYRLRVAYGQSAAVADFLGRFPSVAGELVGRLPVGPEVPGYELREEVGRGGMGVVYRARDLALDRDVAVKLLQDRYAGDQQVATRFAREARITGRLQHPGVPAVHQVGTLPDGRPYLAMKLIRGETLARLLADRGPGPARWIGVFEAVCQAVGYAHAQGVVHRDLKPENVMVGAFGEVQVMDWGLAKELGGAPVPDLLGRRPVGGPPVAPDGCETGELGQGGDEAGATSPPWPRGSGGLSGTATGTVMGTPAFMAPEQARGEPADARSDVYALGAVLFQLLTGEPPHGPGPAEEVVSRAAAGVSAEALARLAACGADAELVALARRCLSAEPAARPADASAVAAAVAVHREDVERRLRESERERAVARTREAEGLKRRRVQAALALAVGLLILGGGAAAWWGDKLAAYQRAAEGERDAEKRFRAEQVREGVRAARDLAVALRRAARFREADAALAQAADLAAGGAPELAVQVGRDRADLALVIKLDELRMKRSTWIPEPGGKGRYDLAGAVRGYPEVFRAAGMDVLGPDANAVAAAVAASPVRAELVAALDDWATLPVVESDGGRILAVLRQADPGPWLDEFRDPANRRDRMALGRLAGRADPSRLPPATLTALAELMRARGLDPSGLLLRAQFAHPNEFLIALQLGLWHGSRREYQPAIANYRAARVTRPDNLAILINLGNALRDSGNAGQADKYFQEATRLHPTAAQPYYNLAYDLLQKNKVDEAADRLREAIRHDPTYAPAHNNLGVAVGMGPRGDMRQAIVHFQDAIKHDPTDARAHYNLASALEQTGNVNGAIESLRSILQATLRTDPAVVEAHQKLARLLSGQGRNKEAVDHLREAVRLAPDSAPAHSSLGIALLAIDNVRGAIAEQYVAVSLDADSVRVHTNLGNALMAGGKLDAAIAECREAIRLDPNFPTAHYNLAIALMDNGNRDEAIAEYRETIRLNSDYAPQAHNNLGLALKAKGDLSGAIDEYRKALRINPQLHQAHVNLAAAYLELKNYPGAIESARAGIKFGSKNPRAHAVLGQALQATGDTPGAWGALTEAARLDTKRYGPLLIKLLLAVAPPPWQVWW